MATKQMSSDDEVDYYQSIPDEIVDRLYDVVIDRPEGRYEAYVTHNGQDVELLDDADGNIVFDRDSKVLDGIRVCLNSSDKRRTVKLHIWVSLKVNATY